jgi:hypothetical protein
MFFQNPISRQEFEWNNFSGKHTKHNDRVTGVQSRKENKYQSYSLDKEIQYHSGCFREQAGKMGG